MKRALVMFVAFVALTAVGVIVGQLSLQQMIEQRLETEGLSWQSSTSTIGQMRWEGVEGEAIEIETLIVTLGWPIDVQLLGARIDSRELEQWRDTDDDVSQWRPRWRAYTEDLTLSWGQETLVSFACVPTHPNISLINGETSIEAARNPRKGSCSPERLQGQLPHPNLSGSGELEFQLGQTITFRLSPMPCR